MSQLLPGRPAAGQLTLLNYMNQLPAPTDWNAYQQQRMAAINAPVPAPAWQAPAHLSAANAGILGGIGALASVLTRTNAVAPLAQMIESQNQQQDDYDYKMAAWQHELDTTRHTQAVNLSADIATLKNREQNDRLKMGIDLMQTDATLQTRVDLANLNATLAAQRDADKQEWGEKMTRLRSELGLGNLLAGITARDQVHDENVAGGMSPEARAAMAAKVAARKASLMAGTAAQIRAGKKRNFIQKALGSESKYTGEEASALYGTVDANVAAYQDSLLGAAVSQTPHQQATPTSLPTDAELRQDWLHGDPRNKSLSFNEYKARVLKKYGQ